MKLRLVDKTIYDIERAEIINGRLEIDFLDKTAEEVQTIFSTPENLATIELMNDTDNVFSQLDGWTKYGGTTLNGDIKTVILTQAANVTEERITSAEADALAAKQAMEQQAEDIEQIKKQMEEGGTGVDQELFAATAVVARANAQMLSDQEALSAKVLYEKWQTLVDAEYTAEKAGYKFTHENILYKTIKDNQQFQAQWVPGQGTESIFERIDETHAGTVEDPIPWHTNMRPELGKYYVEGDLLTKCIEDPGQALQNKLGELCPGRYFEVTE